MAAVKLKLRGRWSRLQLLSILWLLSNIRLVAQDLAPRAYLITPVHSNAVTLSYSFIDGDLLFDGTVPITDAKARVNLSLFSLTHSMRFFGRTANVTASLPYGIGNFHGAVLGTRADHDLVPHGGESSGQSRARGARAAEDPNAHDGRALHTTTPG